MCGFGGVVEKWHDPDADDAYYLQTVSGGIPETQDDLWATSIGPAVVDVRRQCTKSVSLKGKERATGVGIEREEDVQMNLKPLYRDLCKAQMKWERYFVSTKSRRKRGEEKDINQESVSTPRATPVPQTTHMETVSTQTEGPVPQISRRSARIAVKQATATAKETKPTVVPKRSGKRKLIDSPWDGSTPKKAKLPRYNRVHTSLPPLTPLPASLATTHYTKRLFSIIHAETEGTRSEYGPPVVSVKIPSWAEQLDNYPLGKKDIPITAPVGGMGETKMQKWGREMTQGGVGNMAFFFFSDDPRMLWSDSIMNENSRYTVRRGVIGGDLGMAPTEEHTVVSVDNAKVGRKVGKKDVKGSNVQKDGDGDIVMSNGNGSTSLTPPSSQGDTALTNHGVSIERTRRQIYDLTDKLQNIAGEKYYALYRMEQLPANDEPWLHQGQSYSTATVEFIRPTVYNTSFPSFKRLDSKRTLKSSISEHFPALKKLLGTDDGGYSVPNGAAAKPTPAGDLGLNFQRLQKLGLSNPQMRRWAQNNIHSDANLKLVPQLRKKKHVPGPLPETVEGAHEPELAGIEVAVVERLAVDYDNEEEQLEMQTKVNLRWKMPASQDLLSLNPPFEPPPMPIWPPASVNPSAGAPDATASSSTVHAFTTSTNLPLPPFSPPHTPYPHTHFNIPLPFPPTPLPTFGTITGTESASLFNHTEIKSTWEFRSRGPYVVSCDDNDGSFPSTMSCFRASHGEGKSEMGDMLWQRLLVVPLHYKDARLSVSAEVRTKERVESLMHEFYYMDNDGFQLTSSMAIYATRRHIISPQLLAQHKRDTTQEIITEFHAQSLTGLDRSAAARAVLQKKMALLQDKSKRDKWGIGCSSGYKACCEFWMFGLENGHTIKIVSLKEELREVVERWRGWVDWAVSDAGGLVASVGGARDVKWREVVRKVNKLGEKREMDGISKPTASNDKSKKKDKDKDKGKGKEKEKCKPRMKTRSQARKVKQNAGNDSDGEGWTTDDGPELYLLGNQAYYSRCHCPACSPDFEDPMLHGYEDAYHSDYDDEFTSDDEFPLDPRPAPRDPQYHHRYLFCWNFKAHPITPSTKTPTNPGLHLLPLPSKAWWNSDDYHVFVSFSPCGRYIAASSNFRFALWDLESSGLPETIGKGDEYQGKYSDHRLAQRDLWCTRRPEMWKVPRTDLHRWRKGGLFDTWHDREYFATQAEEQDDLECQPFNGIWILWEDVAVPRQPSTNTQDLQDFQPIILEKGVSFINSIDLRRYVDGVNVQADVAQRMEEYSITLEEMFQERAIELEEFMDDEDWLDDPYDHDHFGLGLYPGLGFGMGGYYAGMDNWDDDDEGHDHDYLPQ